jgi:hypothetical protein
MLPNFLIIGAPRCGTTMVYENLKRHPEIFMSAVKEPSFFILNGEKNTYSGPMPIPVVNDSIAYQALFNGFEKKKAVGEASTLYLYSPKAPPQIKEMLPEIKIIVLLRPPVDRAYSHFFKNRLGGIEPIADFPNALAAEEWRIQNGWFPFWFYRDIGRFDIQIERYFRYFRQEQMRFYLLDDFQQNPSETFMDIFQFLGVNSDFRVESSIRFNAAGKPRHRLVHALLSQPFGVKNMLKRMLPSSIQRFLFWKIMKLNLSIPPMQRETQQALQAYYRENILKTQDLIQRDLSAWLLNPAQE